jgi:uncharacterized membrane protein
MRVVRLWPEAILGVATAWVVAVDRLNSSAGDPGYYWEIAGRIAAGELPYRDYPFEYPPISLPPILLPYFMPDGASLDVYLSGLFIENMLLMIAIGLGVLMLARLGWAVESWPRSTLLYGAMALALAPTVAWRFDALATLLSVLAVVAVARNHAALSGVALGAGVMTKLYPLAMLPALFVGRIRNRRLRPALVLGIATVATVAVVAAPFLIGAGNGALSFLEYATARSVQMESLPGALAMLANVLGGPESRIYHGFGTWQVDSPLLAILGPTWTVLTVLLIGLLAVAIWHRYRVDSASVGGLRPTSEVVHLVAALMVVLVSSRILSPQYLFWVAPFVALSSRPKALVFWIACILTNLGYPINFQELLNQQFDIVIVINLRNAILVGFLAWVLTPDLLGALRSVRALVRPKRATAPSG